MGEEGSLISNMETKMINTSGPLPTQSPSRDHRGLSSVLCFHPYSVFHAALMKTHDRFSSDSDMCAPLLFRSVKYHTGRGIMKQALSGFRPIACAFKLIDLNMLAWKHI